MEKQKFIEVENVGVPVSDEVYTAYKRSIWSEGNKNRFRLKAECSLDRIIDAGVEFASDEPLVEDVIVNQLLLEALAKALQTLSDDERMLISALFFEERAERDVAQELGLPKSTIHHKKNSLLKKLKKIFD